jgi:hypothetical protein
MIQRSSDLPQTPVADANAQFQNVRRTYCPRTISSTIPTPQDSRIRLVHLLDELVDLVFSVAQITALDEVLELPLVEAASRAVQLEWPQEVRSLLEVGPDSVNLVDEILHTDHAVLAEILFDNLVVRQRQSLLIDLAISALCTSG